MDPSPDVLACRVVDGLVVEQIAAGRVVVGVDLGTSGGMPLDKVRQSGSGGLEDGIIRIIPMVLSIFAKCWLWLMC